MIGTQYKTISLFSGAMGLDLGIRGANRFVHLACVEKEKVFCDTIRKNLELGNIDRNIKVYEGDIKNLDPHELLRDLNLAPGELDLLVGGPPCQSFSTAGRRGTVQDPRGTLLWDFLRFISVLRPKMFLMENVRGLMSAALKHRPIALRPDKGGPRLNHDEEPGSVVDLFVADLQKIEGAPYRLDCFEVNAVNYGAPQLRERALFIGNRFNEEIDFPKPTHGNPSHEGKDLLFDEMAVKFPPWKTLGDAIGGLVEDSPVIMDFSPRKKKYLSMVPPGGNWRCLPEDIQKESMGKAFLAKGGRSGWWRRLSFDLPCPTLVTMPNHASTALCHPEQIRALTLREYCRIQEFPDEWAVCGSPSQQYAQIGNAVPVRLGQVAGETIARYLDQASARQWSVREGKTLPCKKIYLHSHVRTRQWFKSGQAYAWKDGCDNPDVAYNGTQHKKSVKSLGKGG